MFSTIFLDDRKLALTQTMVELEKWFDPAFQEFIDKEIVSLKTKL
jgi:hypothetical protein